MAPLRIISILMVFCLALGGCATRSPVYQVNDAKKDYTLGVGDGLRVTVFGQENLTGEFKIEQNGVISFPLIGDVPAAGLTASELENELATRLSPDYILDPKVSIDVLTYRSIFVLGEVRAPGQYEYAPNLTIMQAVATAGGYTYRAKEGTVEVTRHVKGALKTFTVDDREMLKPGDTVTVRRRWF